jgi:DNA adenine methylase
VNTPASPQSIETYRPFDLDSPREILKPPLKWAGGKRWQLPYIRSLWKPDQGRRLVEPFAGGLAITLGLAPEQALLNDINEHLINFYCWIQRDFRIEVPLRNRRLLFNHHRQRFNELVAAGRSDSKEAASLFYYLNRTGFNGLCRFNQSGEFNVPFGSYKSISYRADFSPYTALFNRYRFTNVDFEALPIRAGDFIYADPPYDVEFTQYSKERFSWADQVRCATWLAAHDGPVILANQATPRIIKLYRNLGFRLRFLSAPRLISCNGDRSRVREVLALKNL